MIAPDLLAKLANPLHPDRPPVVQKGDYVVCTKTGMGFPIVDGIPHMLPEDAIPAEKMKELLNGPN
ncbi:Trm112 family protein [bacterium]|nr:MAG: Trm112 family protein [bacterium]